MVWGISDITNAVSACLTLAAVVVALVFGLRSISETRDVQKREFRYRLLEDVVQWTERIINWRSESKTALKDMAKATSVIESHRIFHGHLAEVRDLFASLTRRNEYILKVADRLQQGLPQAVEKLIGDLKAYMAFLEKWQEMLADELTTGAADIERNTRRAGEADKYAQQVEISAAAILEKAADVKAKVLD